MRSLFLTLFTLLVALIFLKSGAHQTELDRWDVKLRGEEMMEEHALYKTLTPLIAQRMLENYIDHLDPYKTYFIEPEVREWMNPSDAFLNKIIKDFNEARYDDFEKIHHTFQKAIGRRRELDKHLDFNQLPSKVHSSEFKNNEWVENEEALFVRVERLRGLQIQATNHFSEELKKRWIENILKRQKKNEDRVFTLHPEEEKTFIYFNTLKALASSLDTHTAYYTPEEAVLMLSHVQQMLRGIGAELRDNLNGLTIIKLVEGGPAAMQKELKVKDRIIAVNGEPILGMDIEDAIKLIRGEVNTKVTLTIIRETPQDDGSMSEEKMEITITRGEVALKDARYESSYQPYGDGIIGYVALHSFYEDRETSSSLDLQKEIEKLQNDHRLLGMILDLRGNTGGLLTEALNVTSLFMQKGIVVSVKYDNGRIQHLRNMEASPTWDGPLIILIDRHSASASEIVTKTLQDYGRALIVGDDRTFGKGSFQTFTLSSDEEAKVNPKGEFKVTKGCYYTVSGETPQLVGVKSDIEVPGPDIYSDIGERFGKYPLQGDQIAPNYVDTFSDVPIYEREHLKELYATDPQKKVETYLPYKDRLKANAEYRLSTSKNYQNFEKEIKKGNEAFFEDKEEENDEIENFGINDLQLEETFKIMKDLLFMMKLDGFFLSPHRVAHFQDEMEPAA